VAMTLRERYQIPVAWGRQAEMLGRILPPGLRWRSATSPDEGSADIPSVPIAAPVVVDMVHAQEADELAEARELLKLERDRVEKLRGLLTVDRQRLREERKAAKLEHQRLALAQDRVAITSASQGGARGARPAHYPQQQDLKALLKQHGITQATLAGYAGVTRTMVVNLLAGRTSSIRVHEAAQRLLSVRTRLTELGWSQGELARRIGKNPGLVSRVIRGEITSGPIWEAIEQVTAHEGGRHDTLERKAALKATGHSYYDLARQADVSFSMVFKDLKALRDCLTARGITLQRIALESGVSSAHVTNVMNGRHVSAPVIDAARRLLGETP